MSFNYRARGFHLLPLLHESGGGWLSGWKWIVHPTQPEIFYVKHPVRENFADLITAI